MKDAIAFTAGALLAYAYLVGDPDKAPLVLVGCLVVVLTVVGYSVWRDPRPAARLAIRIIEAMNER